MTEARSIRAGPRRAATAVLLCLLSAAAAAAAADSPVVFVQEPLLFDAQARRPYVGAALAGSRIVMLSPGGDLAVLTDAFASAADPCVSFDGQRMLFSGQQNEGDPWDIWEMTLETGAVTRVTADTGDCREPIYLPLAAVDSPNFAEKVRWIAFTSTAPGGLNDQADGPLSSLYAMSLVPVQKRGTVLWRTTYNLGGDINPTVMRSDGRVLFSGRQRGAYGLLAISWSGENLNSFYGSHTADVSQVSACELPDRTVVFVETEGAFSDGGGRLARVSLRRPLHSRELLVEGRARFRTPHALPDGRLLVSQSKGGSSFGIYTFDPARRGAPQLVYDDPEWHEVDALPVAAFPEPPGRIPTVAFASVLDVGSLKTVGQLQCLNVYDTDRPWPGYVSGQGVATVRLVEGVPLGEGEAALTKAAPDSTWPPRGVRTRVLGEAPVEADGSFYVNVAGDVPFYAQLLDVDGRAVQTMRAWMWVRAGDQRGCIGCHEDKELAPENRATDALVKARPAALTAPPGRRRSYGFADDVMPILTRRCAGCHSGTGEAPALSGNIRAAYSALTDAGNGPDADPAVLPGSSLHSRLGGMVSPRAAHGGLTDAERRVLYAWIDLGARPGWRDTSLVYHRNEPGED